MIWRGWGLLVLLLPFLWWAVLLAVYMATGIANDVVWVPLTIGLALLLSAVTLWRFDRYRERVAPPGLDHLYFIPTKYWVYLFAIGGVGVWGWAFVA